MAASTDLLAIAPDASAELLPTRWRRLAAEAPDAEALVHLAAGMPSVRWTRGPLVARAEAYAAWLVEQGVRRGDVCAIIVRHRPEFAPLYMGASMCGALPAVLAYPNARLHPDKLRDGLVGMSRSSGLDWVLTERALAPSIEPLVSGESSTVRGLLLPFDDVGDRPESAPPATDPLADVRAHDPCLLQHSSGTTGLQKAVVLSHAAVLEHVSRYARAIELDARDKVVSWLPLYHDMGLIAAFHLPLASGVPTVHLDPFEWVSAPVLLLEAIAREAGTITWLPNFALNLLAERVHEDDLAELRLDTTRLIVNCSEPVRAESHARFVARFEKHGLRSDVLAASYAMAETVFAITQTEPGRAPTVLVADRATLTAGTFRHADAAEDPKRTRACVSSGTPLSGCSIRIVDADGLSLPDDQVGEIRIRSVTRFDGYRGAPEKTALVLRDDEIASGDLGFVHDGELYVVGRMKDLIIIAGKNVYPEDIEDAVSRVPGVEAGRVCAFAIDDAAAGTEKVCVVAETSFSDEAARKALKLAILRAAMTIDVTIGRVVLVEPRWLVKSSSGKPSRGTNRERTLELFAQEGTP